MEIKIKNITIDGIRGIKDTLTLPLENKSILIYGDNGSGKSSITDALEWFFMDRVSHLTGSEIDLKEALRNSYLPNKNNSFIRINFSNRALDSERVLEFKKDKFISEYLNKTEEFKQYINNVQNENIQLRYQSLRDFIDKAKGDKLKSLSEIIGFFEINKTKEVFKKALNFVKSEIKNQNFDNQINTQKEILKNKIGAIVSVEETFLKIIAEIIKPLKLGLEINSIPDIDKLLLKLRAPGINPLMLELSFLEKCHSSLLTLHHEIHYINKEYEVYFSEFNMIASDVEGIRQTFLAEILKAGKVAIEHNYHVDDSCPLCLKPINKKYLILEINSRLKEIEEASKKKASFDIAKQTIVKIADDRTKKLDLINNEALINNPANAKLKSTVTSILSNMKSYLEAGNTKVTSGVKIKLPKELEISRELFDVLVDINDKITSVRKLIEKDNTTTTYSNISAAKDAFITIKKIESEKAILENQSNSLLLMFEEFIKRQKEALGSFINKFSGTINEFYQFMNPNEQFEEIKITTMGDDDELTGLTVEYKYNGKWASPPQKYFSESHLNCFGISFFLASVVAFNKESKFFILDDIISSFDTAHRKRFADLLIEKFSNYQIVLLTHESNWFDYMRNAVKNKNWLVNNVKYTESKGTFFDETPENLKAKIELKISDGNTDKLGNDIREYLENILKQIANNLEIKLKYQFNDKNEDRMAYELLTELMGRVSKSNEFKANNSLLERTLSSTFIGNKDSHDSRYTPSMGDLVAFWKDVNDIENIFFCNSCGSPVQLKYYDEATKIIKCKCGKLHFDIKK